MKRTSSLKRTASLKSDPAKTREWQQKRSSSLKRSTRLKPKSEKRKDEETCYFILRGEYLKTNPICAWPGCQCLAVELHHSRGRVGSLYLDTRWFKGLCRQHHRWAHDYPKKSQRRRGFISPTGYYRTMTHTLPQNGHAPLALISAEDAQVLEAVVVGGDLSRLSAAQRVSYYRMRCDAAGLDARTQPFSYITLQGKLTLYATKTATDQLCEKRDISTAIADRQTVGDIYVVTCRASLPSGRFTDATGAVTLGGLKGDALCNAYMKAETKAKRRAVLALCGLGMLDETERETIEGAQTFSPAEVHQESQPQFAEIGDIAALTNPKLREWMVWLKDNQPDHPRIQELRTEFDRRRKERAQAKQEPETVEGEVIVDAVPAPSQYPDDDKATGNSRLTTFKANAPEQFLIFLGACQARKMPFETDADILDFEVAAAKNLDRPVLLEALTGDEWEALAEGVRGWGLKWGAAE